MLQSLFGILDKAINTKLLQKNHSDSPHPHPYSLHSHPYFLHSHRDSPHSHYDSTHFHSTSPHSHHDFPRSNHDFMRSHHSPHSFLLFQIPAFTDSQLLICFEICPRAFNSLEASRHFWESYFGKFILSR